MTADQTQTLDFPGYEKGEPLGASFGGHRITGVKPFDIGIGTVRLSYSGVKVLVDVHLKEIAGFDPRDFPQMQLYPGHLTASGSVSYTIFHKEVRVTLVAIPDERKVVIKFDGDDPIKPHLPKHPINLPYLDGPYPFPDISGLKRPKPFTHDQVQDLLNTGKWHDQGKATGLDRVLESEKTARDLVTMLGGDPWLRESQSTLRDLSGGANDAEDKDELIAFGARVTADAVLSFDKGVGFFFGKEYLGVFMLGQAGIGVALEISIELMICNYWGADDTPGSALDAFQSINGYIKVSGGPGLIADVDFVFTMDPDFRLCGINYGVGFGEGFSVGAGVQKVAAGNYHKP
ncbi:MAG: hypothetical protein AAGI10_02685 [Pseudomonadota bacterium]